MNSILDNDITELVSQKKYFQHFEGSSILITGATGLIGSIMAKALIKYGKIKVFACCRNKEKFNLIFKNYECENLIPIYSDIFDLNILNIDVDYIVHGASVTDSKTFVENPIKTIDVAVDGTRNLLRQCIGKKIKGFAYMSSLEVYGSFDYYEGIKNVTEEDFGSINPISVRSSYSESKRMVENICASYSKEFKIPVKICRLCQTFGAGVEYSDNRVFAQFARSIIENKDIILKTKGETVRNYCYTTDAVSGILTVLSKGKVGEAYNIANNETTISIADMATLVCNLYSKGASKVIFDVTGDASKFGYNPTVRVKLDSKKLMSLGWNPVVPLDEMYKRLIGGMIK
ncbi:NAD-dependent epimerase/dehydratase family protein [Treponema pectinovorum]|uniref:NAD-dependent epimerase/dehydratase family protein n=1 Tax=Treponema pectinovorum TaxID=164 RepID=UPI003D8E2D90